MRADQLAINSITTRQASLEEAVRAYASAGFTQVEFHLPLLKAWLSAGNSIDATRDLLQAHGLRLIGGFDSSLECFSDTERMQANLELQIANMRLIDALAGDGGGTLVVGTDGPATPSLEALPVVATRFRELADATAGLNVAIALEFNWGPLVKSIASARRVCELADRERVGILFDPAHYHCTVSKFEDLTPETVGWIAHVHLNDMADKPGELSDCNADRVLPGQGCLDLAALIGRLDEGGYAGSYSIELFNEELWQQPAAEAASRCYQSLLPYCSGR